MLRHVHWAFAYIFTGFLDRHTAYMPDSVLRMLLHGLCDEAVRRMTHWAFAVHFNNEHTYMP